MLSRKFDKPIHLEPGISREFLYFTVAVHILVIVAVIYPSAIALAVKLFLLVFVSASLAYHLWTQLKHRIPKWIWQQSGEWITGLDNFQCAWHLGRIYAITPWFIALGLRAQSGNHTKLLIFRDQIDAQSFRRLRVRLKMVQVDAAMPGDTI